MSFLNLRAPIRGSHQPWLLFLLAPCHSGDARPESKTLKRFYVRSVQNLGFEALQLTVKDDGDEKNHKIAADRYTERHADEDAMEQDSDLKKNTLQPFLAQLQLRQRGKRR